MAEKIDLLKEKLTEQNGFSGVISGEINNYPCIEIPKEKILEISALLKDEFHFDQCRDLIGVDRFTKKDRFECIYNFYSTEDNARIFFRVKLDSKNPEVESISHIWLSANWMEREAYDMYGINFLHHPDLRRMYMMEEFEYYPLRKDYPLMGIPGAIQLPKK